MFRKSSSLTESVLHVSSYEIVPWIGYEHPVLGSAGVFHKTLNRGNAFGIVRFRRPTACPNPHSTFIRPCSSRISSAHIEAKP
jgi:hypothetical protein